jgi:hypothetical protein
VRGNFHFKLSQRYLNAARVAIIVESRVASATLSTQPGPGADPSPPIAVGW